VGYTLTGLWGGWIIGVLLGLIALIVTWRTISRRFTARLTPLIQQTQRCTQAGNIKGALAALEQLLAYGKWVPLLSGQVHGQMGVLSHHAGDPKAARTHLQRAGPRATDAQMLLAALQYRDQDPASALRTLERAALANRRHAMLPNVQAFLLHEQGKTDQALSVLSAFLKREPGHEASKDNLLRLQNDRKLNMKSFGMPWYALGIEDPPASMGVMQTGRKGFRTPPKKRRG
jgi:tetratricopeptide (TPR) repeat protein